MERRAQAIAATALGAVVVTLVALGSAMALPPLVTTLPTTDPMEPPEQDQVPAPPAASSEAEPTVAPAPDVGGGDLLQLLVTAVAVVIAVALVIMVVRVARNIAARERVQPIDDVIDQPEIDALEVEDVMRAARERIGVDEDPNRVVVQCWEALEAIAADAGVVRHDAETATEYVVDMLGRLDLPAGDARRLSRLYTAALFSRDRLGADAVADARECLDRLASALQARTDAS